MSRKLSDLYKRLAKVEQQAAHIATQEKLANCNCYPHTVGVKMLVVKDAKEFEADMNLSCPAHGIPPSWKANGFDYSGPERGNLGGLRQA